MGDATETEYASACAAVSDSDSRAIRAVLDRIGDKWSLLVIGELSHGVRRFTGLLRGIPGVSQRMLTLTLRQLERDGLVTRTVHAEVPPRVEYELTPVGETLIPHAIALAHWAVEHYTSIETSRASFDAGS